jgi:hypothetical protein
MPSCEGMTQLDGTGIRPQLAESAAGKSSGADATVADQRNDHMPVRSSTGASLSS